MRVPAAAAAAAAMRVIRRPFSSSAAGEFDFEILPVIDLEDYWRRRRHLNDFISYITSSESPLDAELDGDFGHSVSFYASVLKDLTTQEVPFHLNKALTCMMYRCGSVQDCLFLVDFWKGYRNRLTRKSYNSLLLRLSTHGLVGEMKCLYTDMLERRVSPRDYTYNLLIYGYCKIGYVVEARQYVCKKIQAGLGVDYLAAFVLGYFKRVDVESTFKDMPWSRNVVSYNPLIHGLCDAGRIDEALSLFSGMKDGDDCKKKAMRLLPEMRDRGFAPSLVTYNLFRSGQGRSGNFDNAYRLLGLTDCFQHRQTHSCIIGFLIHGYCKTGKLDHARFLFDCFPPDSYTFTALIHGLCNDGNLKEALSMVDNMVRMGLQPRVCTRTILIRQMLKQGAFDEARSCFNDMLSSSSSGEKPDAQTYNAFVEAYCSAGRVQEAEDMMVKMKAHGVPPDFFTYTLLIKAYAHLGMTCSAFHVLKRMSDADSEPSHHTFLSLIKHLAAGKVGETKCIMWKMLEFDVLVQLFKKMVEHECTPDANCYEKLIFGTCEVDNLGIAQGLLDQMEKRGMPLLGYCKRKDLDSAFQVLDDVPCSRNFVTYSHLIKLLCDGGKPDEALSLYARMKDDDCIDPTADTYDVLIKGLCKKNVHKAMRLLPDMLDRPLFPSLDTFNMLIAGQCRSGNFDTAYRLLGLMDYIPNKNTHGSIIDFLCRSKRVEEARVLFDSLALRKRNEAMYSFLIHGYCKAGKMDHARVLFEEMESDGCCFPPDSSTFTALIRGLCDEGGLEEALSMVEKMVGMGLEPTVCTRTILIRQMLKEGGFDEARACFNDMLSSDAKPDAQTYNAFVEAYCSAERVQEAEDMMVKMKADGVPPDVVTYTLLIKAYGHLGMTCSAFHVLKRMSDASCEPSHHIFLALIKHLASGVAWKMMEFDVIVQLFEKMVQHGCNTPDADCYEKLILGMCEVGNLGIAQRLLEEMEKRGMPLPPSEMVSNALVGCCCKLQKYEEAAKVVENMICCGQSPELEYCKRVILNLYRGGAKERGRSVFKKLLRCGYYFDDEIAWKILIDGLLKDEHVDADAYSEMFQAMQEHGCKFCPQTHQSLIQGKTDPAKAVAPYTSDLFTFGTEFYSL
ncbi:unnamed protein product [Microthlaspi erraticum]|uniref:Pentacotripeptide-repeat region of PRORP domain-containing protein n=1 Tax=Microthlaspi erraticum TaxID=1685480 RepID=A0A6D2J584_9BRAS|nr:unnamed protein product [Microthlaspi erraticum]